MSDDLQIALRTMVRQIMARARRGRPFSLVMLRSFLAPDFDTLTESDVREALRWNHERGFVERKLDEENERELWFITEAGRRRVMEE